MVIATLGVAMELFRAHRYDDAERALTQLLEDQPENGDVLEGLGYIAAKRAEYSKAADLLDRVVALKPGAMDVLHYAGVVNLRSGRLEKALGWLTAYVSRAPHHAAAVIDLAECHRRMGDYGAAHLALAALLDCRSPVPIAHYAQGCVFGAEGRYAEEVLAYQRAIALRPDFVDAYVNAGVALREMLRFEDALVMFKKALSIDPDHASARNNRAQTNLQLGRYEHGWRDYEWRWRDGVQRHGFTGKLWLGETSLRGKTIVVHAEQGLGDSLQFVRYLDCFEGMDAQVILQVPSSLVTLLQTLTAAQVWRGYRVSADRESLPNYDFHVPLLSLPLAFYKRLQTVPDRIPYLYADPDQANDWRQHYAALNPHGLPLIGLVWSGSRKIIDDQRPTLLSQWASVLALPLTFVSLQKDVPAQDQAALAQSSNLVDASTKLTDFAQTAAAMQALDLIITIDTSTAHLAGALGLPVWTVLAHKPDWRWQLDRDDSDWYPTMTLFRQRAPGDWTSVIERVEAALRARFGL